MLLKIIHHSQQKAEWYLKYTFQKIGLYKPIIILHFKQGNRVVQNDKGLSLFCYNSHWLHFYLFKYDVPELDISSCPEVM